ncbi:hypothetical protein M422DRAFT_197712 [Sphaerobolus stellatus SS14]|nr:hypothetical protein M422DRAFT_197712 [Sphaerobolus stellatus SS14]
MLACDAIESNRSEARQLQERCRFLIFAINSYDTPIGSSMEKAAKGCELCFSSILDLLSRYTKKYNKWELFIHQKQISQDIKASHTKIDDCCREFHIRSDIRLHQWQNENERTRKEDHDELKKSLRRIDATGEDIRAILQSNHEDIRTLLDMLQKQLGTVDNGTPEFVDLETSLYTVHKKSGQLLPDVDINKEIRRIGKHPVAGNAAFDVWEGLWLGREKVAMKTIRGVQVTPNTRKRFTRESEIWRQVWEKDRGRYILPLHGICFEDGPFPYLVSPWMPNGNVMDYLKKYPNADRLEIIKGVAKGLSLLHNFQPNPIAHGDLKGANILIDDIGQPLLADFGLSKIMENLTGVPFTQSKGISESYRWFAPEMCCSPGIISLKSDIFAFSMTVIEIFTGRPPYDHIHLTTEVLFKMQLGDRPKKPNSPELIARGFTDNIWDVISSCWDPVPEKRPSIDEILLRL